MPNIKKTGVCEEIYIVEKIRMLTFDVLIEDTSNIKEYEPATHLGESLNHSFKGKTLLQAPKIYRQQKYLEAFFIATVTQD